MYSLSSEPSTKEKIEMINEIRRRINRASNLLSGHLSRLTLEENEENQEHIRRIKREIHTILSQLADLRVFCSKSTKKEISRLSDKGVEFTMFQPISMFDRNRHLIDHWASLVLTLGTGIDLTKWPLELEAGIKGQIKNFLEGFVKVKTKRPS